MNLERKKQALPLAGLFRERRAALRWGRSEQRLVTQPSLQVTGGQSQWEPFLEHSSPCLTCSSEQMTSQRKMPSPTGPQGGLRSLAQDWGGRGGAGLCPQQALTVWGAWWWGLSSGIPATQSPEPRGLHSPTPSAPTAHTRGRVELGVPGTGQDAVLLPPCLQASQGATLFRARCILSWSRLGV